jgi:hypothetical protein
MASEATRFIIGSTLEVPSQMDSPSFSAVRMSVTFLKGQGTRRDVCGKQFSSHLFEISRQEKAIKLLLRFTRKSIQSGLRLRFACGLAP